MATQVTGPLGATKAQVESADARARLSCDRAIELLMVFMVVASLIGLVTTLCGVFQAPQVLLASLILTCFWAYKTHGFFGRSSQAPRWRHIVLLVLVALLFRVPAYHYVMGGQDEGLYVNIAHTIEHSGGIAIHDEVKQKLQGSPYLARYLSDNTTSGGYLAGVNSRGPNNSKLDFLFYDLFPIWMALLGGIVGSSAGIYALTLFSLFSIVLFYRLTLLITRSYHAALLSGALLAVSPLHAFFSKFPVTEVPTLCFALAGFVTLADFWSSAPAGRKWQLLALSVLAFMCVFTTRISGFMYVPFFIGLACASALLDQDVARRRAVTRWAMWIVAAYLLSVIYGLIWSHSYSHWIYRSSFQPLFGTRWKLAIGLAASCAFAGWAAVVFAGRYGAARDIATRWVAAPLRWLPLWIAYVSLCLGLFKIFQLGWTNKYLHDPALAERWHFVGTGWLAASASSLWTLIVFLGPLIVIAFYVLMFKRTRDARLTFMRWWAAGFLVFALLLQWVTPYSPYYARYMLSEVVPYVLLTVVCTWSELSRGTMRKWLRVAIVASILYGSVLSAAQIGKSENDGVYRALAQLTEHTDSHDLILLQAADDVDPSAVKTPLLYTFHRTVVTVTADSLANHGYIAKLNSLYDDVFLITPQYITSDKFTFVDSARFKVMQFAWNHSFPHRLVVGQDVLLNMYRMDQSRLDMDSEVSFAMGQEGTTWLRSGWNASEAWGVWSSGDSATLAINPARLPDSHGELALDITANAFVSSAHPIQHVTAMVDGACVAKYVVKYPIDRFSMRIPLGFSPPGSHKPLTVELLLPDAASPRSFGVNADARDLAVGLVSAHFVQMPSNGAGRPAAASCTP